MCLLKSTDLHKIFSKLDRNGDGYVSVNELSWFLDKIEVQIQSDELETIVGQASLDLQEFIHFCESIYRGEIKEEEGDGCEDEENQEKDLVEAFKVFDLNDDGFISSEELESVLMRLGLWERRNGRDCASMICQFDTNSDGVLDFQEFKNMMLMTIP